MNTDRPIFSDDPLVLATANQRRASAPDTSVWVAASAGTGKTKVLTDRVLRLLLTGTAPQRLLCLTYTKAATAEMATRIASRLSAWAAEPDDHILSEQIRELTGTTPDQKKCDEARRLFARVLDVPGGLKIQTLHAFCQSLLQRFPLEAEVLPHFTVLDEQNSALLLIEARDAILARAWQGDDPDLEAALATVAANATDNSFTELLQKILGMRGRITRMLERHQGPSGTHQALARRLGVDPAATYQSIIEAACADSAIDQLSLVKLAEALTHGGVNDKSYAPIVRSFATASALERIGLYQDYEEVFITRTERTPRKNFPSGNAKKFDPKCADIANQETTRLFIALEQMRAAEILQRSSALITLSAAIIDAYAERKRQGGWLDYPDLILKARDLVTGKGKTPTAWVMYKLDEGIDHILVDEAQDSNPEQWELVTALTDEFFAGQGAHDDETIRTVFAVGDVKQSIFSFQGADPNVFLATGQRIGRRATDAKRRFDPVELHVSFRSVSAVLQAVDAVFLNPDAQQGVALDNAVIRHIASRTGESGLVELWPTTNPRSEDPLPAWQPPVEQLRSDSPRDRLAELIARRIRHMLDSQEILEATGRAIEPQDIMILLRHRGQIMETLVRALKTAGVPVAGIDRMQLTNQIAIMDLMALGRILLLPEDDLSLACVLKGPLIDLGEDRLFDLAHYRHDTESLWASLLRRSAEAADFSRAYKILAHWLLRADLIPPFELYSEILNTDPLKEGKTGRQRLYAWLGTEIQDPLDEFLAQALAYEKTAAVSLEGFLHWLSQSAAEIKREMEQGNTNAVRIVTVHGAKGLEAPIVFLPDTTQIPQPKFPLLWIEDGTDELLVWAREKENLDDASRTARDQAIAAQNAEYRRLLYVAMTRAADRLYISGWKNKKPATGTWYDLINDGFSSLAQPVDDRLLNTAPELDGGKILRHATAQTKPAVSKPRPEQISFDDKLPSWAMALPLPDPIPPRPLMPSAPLEIDPPALSPLAEKSEALRRRGILVHRLLQILPDLPLADRHAAANRYLRQKIHGLEPAEQEHTAKTLMDLLASHQFTDVFASGSLAEVPIIGRIQSARGPLMITGQIDRLIVTPDHVMIVDYKTGRLPPQTPEAIPPAYLRQMAAYQAILRQLYPQLPIRTALLWTETPSLMEIPPALLNRYDPMA